VVLRENMNGSAAGTNVLPIKTLPSQ
jgi:hypothetical protein